MQKVTYDDAFIFRIMTRQLIHLINCFLVSYREARVACLILLQIKQRRMREIEKFLGINFKEKKGKMVCNKFPSIFVDHFKGYMISRVYGNRQYKVNKNTKGT